MIFIILILGDLDNFDDFLFLSKFNNFFFFLIFQENASTIITSHVRGYLVRRLFATECVQSIVQTIRDTLLFVLDVQEESEKNNNKYDPSDIKLKAQLLQSLSSSCYSLHRIFFDNSLKDRLLIIGRDRELIRKKLERNRSY